MNLTKYNPNNDRGITTQPNVSGLRCFDGEDLCKSFKCSGTARPDTKHGPINLESTFVQITEVLIFRLGCYSLRFRVFNVFRSSIVKEDRERLQKQQQKEWIQQQISEKQAKKE